MNDELAQFFLLGSFALGLVLTCKCAVRLAVGTVCAQRWTGWVFGFGTIAATGILAADSLRRIDSVAGAELAPIYGLPICALAVVALALHARVASLRLPARELILRPGPWLLLVWSIGLSAWSAARFYELDTPAMQDLAITEHPELAEERQFVGVSDRGRKVPLFHMKSQDALWPAGFQALTPALRRMAQTVIVRSAPDASSNCHGWVFADGKYLLAGQGVQTILDDNGYQECTDPRPGDLIVYQSGPFLIHTGLVSVVLADGTVLIESKWNLQERFLHRPEDQPYSREYTYYRTPRGSHRITVQDQREETEDESHRAISQGPPEESVEPGPPCRA